MRLASAGPADDEEHPVSTPLVGILVGAKADLPVMEQASRQLEQLAIPHTLDVLSAHRDPDAVRTFAAGAADAGYQVLIASAGRGAHLPGVVAAYTALPVIGVPCLSDHLGGADALYATVQMPAGVPVATVGLDGARNAAILAAQILATGDPAIGEQVRELRRDGSGEGAEHREVLTGRDEGAGGFGFQARR
jgi:5-(carboxyamino)imidazole ribonucleotide mutase